ncbi:hypothetical protein QC762_0111070 [Podospora pseudocomata]|uniref:Uncharacterized protein n=1 Tax=Podospora pseudocomata TaxID=2093779 RepID=A0ABR0G4C2_9PEZI|nr:hypothetical protein QC762_0111070 [Podospora pseudocomata]
MLPQRVVPQAHPTLYRTNTPFGLALRGAAVVAASGSCLSSSLRSITGRVSLTSPTQAYINFDDFDDDLDDDFDDDSCFESL